MERRKTETEVEPHSEDRPAPSHQSERKRRFQIIKLEERIAPGGGNNITHGNGGGCGLHNGYH